ncbi:drebrin-like protein [Sitodiplosis mosellana]|uniref:drebrin-like protein n=1 Tax=Sitodiplosis mosellana TaxID=263140 RepID=UPI0024438015|nr:drebrin-like protein [Sitodiplosis mosellana]XP_055316714.1 drebrin-like protein [Sitodiplosis mosellana]
MSVDLDKNRNDIVNAWKDVVDAKTDTDWALFGYEGHSNALKVVSTGNGGLIELADELNSGKILYGFLSITNEKNNLIKYLLINWQGEGAPTLRKGTCANHIRDISKILTGAHLTLNARTEDDIETDRILEKLNSIRFAVKEKDSKSRIEDEPQKVVGTNYSRVIPSKEINSKDRDSFWKKEEEEERIRTEGERAKQTSAKLELEKEQRHREQQEHSEREKRRLEATPERNSNGVKLDEPKNIQIPKPSVDRSTTQAEEMRQQRNQEARQLIGDSVDKAKAIFAQNTAAGQLQNKAAKTAPVKPVRNSITRSATNQRQQQSPEPEKSPQHGAEEMESPTGPQSSNNNLKETSVVADQPIHNLEDDDSDPYSTIKRSPYTKVTTNSQSEPSANNVSKQADNVQTEAITTQPNDTEQKVAEDKPPTETEAVVDDLSTYDGMLQDQGLRARALYDYQADDESEITFDPGDIITHIDQIDEGWWQGLGPDGAYGLFPANYVELLN